MAAPASSWSGSFDREVTDIFAVQAELAAAVIDAIAPAARGDAVAAPPPTTNLDAHDHYLLGLAAQRSRSAARLAESVAQLEQAVALDPSYAQAHAALANSLLLWWGYSGGGGADSLAHAEQAAYKALALDASLSDAHGALGNVLRYADRPGAEDEYKRALELNPNNAIVTHDYAVLLSQLPGREADSVALSERILELDPRSAIAWTNKLGHVFETEGVAAYQKQFEKAMQVFAGDTDGLETLVLAVQTQTGHPYEAYRLSHELERASADRTTVLRASLGPLIEMADYDESLARIDTLKAAGAAQALETAPLEIMAAGLKGDFKRLDETLAIPERSEVSAHYRYVVDAYWYAAQRRFEDAAAALAKAGEFETVPDGGFLGASLGVGALPAVVRTYQADGREHEAQAMVSRSQEKVRKELGARPLDVAQNVLLAEIALAAGQRAKAVRHLTGGDGAGAGATPPASAAAVVQEPGRRTGLFTARRRAEEAAGGNACPGRSLECLA